MEYKEARRFLEQANAEVGEMGIEALRSLLDGLEHPEKQLSFVHVGGTNGKGSVCAYLTGMLSAAGYRVGRYVSPTIRGYRERIQMQETLEGEQKVSYISPEELVEYTVQLQDVYKQMKAEGKSLPSTFELETALGFLYFQKHNCDVVLLEVGLGGRLDATNVIEHTLCTVLTSISMDHMQVLGDCLEDIAREKAGIIKPNGLVVAYDYESWAKEQGMEDVISPVIKSVADEQNATCVFTDFTKIKNETHDMEGITFDYKNWNKIWTPLLGENQVKNLAVAIEAAEQLKKRGVKIHREQMMQGIAQTVWGGRFEVVKKDPYYILDGAHNEDAARSLKRSLQLYLPNKKLLFIVGILADKNYETILKELAPLAEKIIAITPDSPRGLPAEQLALVAEKYCTQVMVGGDMTNALKLAEKEEREYDAVLVFGSLYSLHLAYDFFDRVDKDVKRSPQK